MSHTAVHTVNAYSWHNCLVLIINIHVQTQPQYVLYSLCPAITKLYRPSWVWVIFNYLNLYLQCAWDSTDSIIQGQNSACVILDYTPLILLKASAAHQSAAHHSHNAHNHTTKIYQLNCTGRYVFQWKYIHDIYFIEWYLSGLVQSMQVPAFYAKQTFPIWQYVPSFQTAWKWESNKHPVVPYEPCTFHISVAGFE